MRPPRCAALSVELRVHAFAVQQLCSLCMLLVAWPEPTVGLASCAPRSDPLSLQVAEVRLHLDKQRTAGVALTRLSQRCPDCPWR
jgi:hypothetical protein